MHSMASRRMGFGKNQVGWAERSEPTKLLRRRQWWARRRCAFAHPTTTTTLRHRHSIRAKLARLPAKACCADVEGARAFLFALALRQRGAAMPAGPRRDRKRLAGTVAARLIAREIDHV